MYNVYFFSEENNELNKMTCYFNIIFFVLKGGYVLPFYLKPDIVWIQLFKGTLCDLFLYLK